MVGDLRDEVARTAAAAVAAFFDQQSELDVEEVHPGRAWFTVLRGEHKRTIPVYLEVGKRDLVIESFFMQAPDQHEAEVYATLLRRNTRTYVLRFALYDSGDVMIVGVVPNAGVNLEVVDAVMGQVLTAADETYDPALRAGFTDYIEREQAWREKVGLSRNPIS